MSRGSGRRRTLAAAGAGALVVLALWLKGLIPGMGRDADAPPPGERLDVRVERVVVKGDQCTHDGSTKPCPEVCAGIEGGDTALRVEIDGTEGAHGAVEAFEKCLTARHIGSISIGNR